MKLEPIHRLRDVITTYISGLRARGELHPRQHPHFRTDFSQWEYGEKGIGTTTYQSSLTEKPVWWGGPAEAVVSALQAEVKQTVHELQHLSPNVSRLNQAVRQLCMEVVLRTIEEGELHAEELKRLEKRFVSSMNSEKVGAEIHADLLGVSILTSPISFNHDGYKVRLRAIEKADLEREVPLEFGEVSRRRIEVNPSAMIELDYQAVDISGWQPPLERAIAILQLFGAGGVRWSRVLASSDSLLKHMDVYLHYDQGDRTRRTYAIRDEDAVRLPTFWQKVGDALPEHFYWESPEDPADLYGAFFNYERVAGPFGHVNEQIAEVIRSLESLFLDDSVMDRISSTLRHRAATLLQACGYPGTQVRNTLRLAYEVRSRFVHGARLSTKTEEEIKTHAGDTFILFSRCLEYNRAALVAAIVSKSTKEELIRAMDSPSSIQRIANAYHEAEGRAPSKKRRRRRHN
jgi:hypothetical protein